MKCPKCDTDMKKGMITLPNNVTWYPGEKKMGIVKDQIWLAGRMSLLGKQAEAYICKKDNIVSFQYPG